MKQIRIFFSMMIIATAVIFNSCAPSIKTTAAWVNKEKIPATPIKSVFIIAFSNDMELRGSLENNLALAAEKRGMKAYKSLDIIGPVGLKEIAPVKDVFLKKLEDLGCESIFTVALIDEKSETRYVPGSSGVYSPYGYGAYGGYGGYGGYGMYGGFGGYYGYTVNMMYSPGYYTTDKTYFIEGKLFDLKSGDLLLSIQSKADNPEGIEKSSKQYTQTLMQEIKELGLNRK